MHWRVCVMWMPFIAGWLLGSISLYVYMFVTAKEAQDSDCMECYLPECAECPYQSRENSQRLAA